MSQEILKSVICPRCGYKWDTKSNHIQVSCPSCYKKVKVNENKVK